METLKTILAWGGLTAVVLFIILMYWYCRDNDIPIWPWEH